ncbi:tight junction-associated protein [Pimephales promelas]|nr:tight junction-associated protein [Pimephales promelas]
MILQKLAQTISPQEVMKPPLLNLIITITTNLKNPTIIPITIPIQSLTILNIMSIQNLIIVPNQNPTIIILKITIITLTTQNRRISIPIQNITTFIRNRTTIIPTSKRIITMMITRVIFATLQLASVSYHESSSFLKEKDSELERLTRLQEQNEVLHHNLLQTTVRMECMGSEFKTGHQLIESELQRTRIELNSLLERFTRLQENYSSTQQTNHLLEKKLHCVAQNMDGERERLNQRISELSDQLSTAKTTIQSLETINVTSMLQDALVKHLKSDDPITPLPVAPPPAQFMDSDRYDKVSMHGDDQSLGTLPEEEESDWSEMGEEAQICVLRGSQGNRENASYYQWQQSQGCWEGMNQYSKGNVDTESDSGGEESKCHQPPHGLQIPHLKFTVHPETLPIPVADVSLACFNQGPDDPDCDGYRITDVRNLGSPIRVLSASLEEIHSIGILKQQEQQQDHHKSMMDLHQSQVCTRQVLYEDEIECDWREANSHGAGEHLNGMVGLESAQKMLNHYIHDGESTHL